MSTPPPPAPPTPIPDADSACFWAACQEGRLTAQCCAACGQFRWPPRAVCPGCGSWAHAWQTLPLRGIVQSFVVPHRAFNPAFVAEVPYVVAHVAIADTADRVVLIARWRGADWSALAVGQVVRVGFDADGRPEFHPA